MTPLPDAGHDARTREAAPLARPSPNQAPSHCLDCGEPLRGRFCSRCGQEATPLHVPVREIVSQTLGDLFSLDSRAWVTLRRLVARPGFLAVEYWHGRRTRYVPPIRLYLMMSFVSFLVLIPAQRFELSRTGRDSGFIQVGIQGGSEEEIAETVAGLHEAAVDAGPVTRLLIERVAVPVVDDVPAAQRAYAQRLPALAFLLVPILALELMLLFRRRGRDFVDHLVMALHLQSFFFVAWTATTLIGLVTREWIGELLMVSALAIYAYRALRNAYEERSRLLLLLKMAIQALVHAFVLGFALLATFVVVGLSL